MENIGGDIIILHMCTKNHNHMMHGLIYGLRQTEFCGILDHFVPFFTPLTIPKIKIWNKEKTPADLTGLH